MAGPQENPSPGRAIAAARRARALSVEDLAERTKIPAAMLQAIEADEFHRLSGPLYARSFLRSCAKELGLPADEVLDLYTRQAGEPLRALHETPRAPEVVHIRRVGLPWGRLAAGGGVVVALAVVAVVLTRPGGERPAAELAAPGLVAGSGMLAGGAGDEGAPATAADGTAAGGGDLAGTGGGPADGPGAADAAPAAPPVRRGPPPAGMPGLAFADGQAWPVVVRLTAAYPVTARARRDGEAEYVAVAWSDSTGGSPVPDGGIVAGQAYTAGDGLVVYWGAVDRISLLLGSVDGVEVTVNGRPQVLRLPAPGDEVRLELRAAPATLP